MPKHQWSQAAHRNASPDVPRPALETWQSLESERIRWEGQVQIIGQDADLPALLVITGKRLALIANNEIALEFPLAWMRPEPKLTAENGIRLFISPDGNDQISQPMLLRAKAGRGAAAEIGAVLTGRTFNSRAENSAMHIPEWKDRVGAAPSVALPQLNDDANSTRPTQKAAWPPAETNGVSSTKKPDSKPKPSANIAPWRVGSDVPKPAPVPTEASRAARLLGTSRDGYTVSESLAQSGNANIAAQSERKHRFPLWLLNLAVVALLVAGFGYVAAERGYGLNDMRGLVPGNVAEIVGWVEPTDESDVAMAPGQDGESTDAPADGEEAKVQEGGDNTLIGVKNTTNPTETPTEEVANAAVNNDGNPMDSIGGSSGDLPITESAANSEDEAEEPAATEEVVETEVPAEEEVTEEAAETEVPTEAAEEEVTEEAVETEVPAEEKVTEEATESATETQVAPLPGDEEEPETSEPTEEAVETEVPTEEAVETEVPTEEAVETEVPTEAAEEEATEEVDPTVPQPTETPAPTAAPTQETIAEQPASVAEGEIPSQEFQAGGIRYSIDAVKAGASIEELPQINNIGQTWVVVTLTGANTSEAEQQFSMGNFILLADGNAIPLDTGTGWVNGLLGNEPAYGNTDSATWAAGEQHQFTLTFLAPANVSSLTLVAGDQQIALDPAITNSVGLNDVARDEAPAAVVTGTVVEVVDGQTIVVDVDGEQITVRYLGIEAPTGDACYASEATAANAELVEGQTVSLERQSVDTTARGLWVRDVWVTGADGTPVLVSQALVNQGVATSDVSEPNSRYAGWLGSTQQTAEDNAVGLWGNCGN